MSFLFLCIAVALAIALAYWNSRVGELRSQMGELRDSLLDRIRQLDRRVELLEKASAEQRMRETRPAEAPIPHATPEPARVAPQAAAPVPPAARTEAPAPPALRKEWIPEPAPRPQQPVQPPTPPPTPPPSQPAFTPPPAAFHTPAQPAGAAEASSSPALSLEERLGGNWLAKLGVSILVVGVAFFLAPRLLTMGPVGKSLTGLAVSLALLGGGLWLERKPAYRIFARAGIGGGWALLFFTVFAMHHLAATRVIDSLVLDLLLMLLVAAAMVLHSLRYESESATGLAFLLGFATLATSHFESAGGTVVFSLVASAVLALGLVVVTATRHWVWLELAGLVAVTGNHFLWLALLMPALGGKAGFPLFWQSTALILFYWALFRAAYLLRTPLSEDEDRVSSLTAIVATGGVLGLLKFQSAHPEWTFRALAAMGSVEMLLAFWARGRRKSVFLVLSTIATVLLVAAVPYRFHGVSWPVLWLVEAHVLALCGLRLGEPIFRRLGLLAGFAASVVLLTRVVLLASFRLDYPDPARHWPLTVGLALAAALFWVHAEVYPRRFAAVAAGWSDLESTALAVTGWLGLGAAAAALWVVLPAQWVAVGWLALVVALGLIADWKALVSLALQTDLLAVMAVAALFVLDFSDHQADFHLLAEALAIALLYAGMRRGTVLENSPAYVAPAYSWAASILLLFWIGDAVPDQWTFAAWAAMSLALYETGQFLKLRFLRWQGLVPAAVVFIGIQAHWFDLRSSPVTPHGWFSGVPRSDLLSLALWLALAFWLQERTRAANLAGQSGMAERRVGALAGAAATLSLVWWLPALLPSWGVEESATVAWAVFSVLLLAISLAWQRRAFAVYAVALCAWVGFFGLILSMGPHKPLPWWESGLFRLSLASAILAGGLSLAFPLRALAEREEWFAHWPGMFRRPEQWFFFVPFGLMLIALEQGLQPGSLTLAWSLLGLGAFILALPLGERSFRLAGLGLLLLCVAKVLLMDVWTFQPTDRYITLIGMGCALLLVSFLYTRFRDFLRRYL